MNFKNSLFVFFIATLLYSCSDPKEILLPKSDRTLIKEVSDLSKIDFFFSVNNNDTLVNVSKNTVISTTNWVFNIDKRLPLKLVVPEIIKLQEKKRKRKSQEDAPKDNFYTYADSIGKNLAFIPFTNVQYVAQSSIPEKQENSLVIRFDKGNKISCNKVSVDKTKLDDHIREFYSNKKIKVYLVFDKELSFNNYLLNKIMFTKLVHPNLSFDEKEFVF